MTKRNIAIINARVAGYHHDAAAFTRLVCCSRVARQHLNEAWAVGERMKEAGVKCDCFVCSSTH